MCDTCCLVACAPRILVGECFAGLQEVPAALRGETDGVSGRWAVRLFGGAEAILLLAMLFLSASSKSYLACFFFAMES